MFMMESGHCTQGDELPPVDLPELPTSTRSKRALCLFCRGCHSLSNSCPCFRCGYRHEGDCASVCRICGRCHSAGTGCNRRSSSYFTAAKRAQVLIQHHVVRPAVPTHYLGPMSVVCIHCRARSFVGEKLNCCRGGTVIFSMQSEIPPALSELILCAHVRQHFRSYNTVMAFASTGHNNKSFPDGTFVLGGRSYHLIGSLLPSNGENHSFSQIWSLDTEDATARRQSIMPSLRDSVLKSLHELFMAHNPLAQMFNQAANSAAIISNAEVQAVGFSWRDSDDMSSFQVGSVVENGGMQRHIVVNVKDGRLKTISDGHRLYHALAYPLLFPTGFPGWHYDMEYNNRKISLTEFGRFMLMHRDAPTHVQRCERLALEYYCDMFAQVESRNIAFHLLATQQAKYSKASARTIIDQLHADNRREIGNPVVLPSSFPNSPRYYHNLYLDAVALPRRFGKPDLFITMTANPAWKEISESIPAGSHWTHHQDIVARVFYLKFKAMMDLIVKKKLFGEVLGHVWRIEWQARGMPHAHILIILKNKILSPRHIDEVVWAEIPCPTTHPILHSIVLKRMIHDPCDTSPEARCRQKKNDGTCYRFFPKEFNTVTTVVGMNSFVDGDCIRSQCKLLLCYR
jgi:hypothetical protein